MKRTALGLHKPRSDAPTDSKSDSRHQETQLDPIRSDWQIFRGPPAFTHVSLPAIFEYEHNATSQFVAKDHVVRLTSPYQPFRAIADTDINTGTGTANYGAVHGTNEWLSSGGSAFQTQWYNLYADLYKYYSVLACRYHISFENFSGDKMYVHIMKYNKTPPPNDVSNHDMELWPGVQSYLSTPHAVWYNTQQMRSSEADQSNMETDTPVTGQTNSDVNANWGVSRNGNRAVITHSDTYEAGSTQQEIILDENVSTWTPVNQNPQLPENLLIRIKSYDAASFGGTPNDQTYGRTLTYNLKIKVEFLCEFRELQEGFRYPVRRNPIRINQVIDKLANVQ